MPKFIVAISDSVIYDVEAETENEAVYRALEWFTERKPEISVAEVEG